MLIAKNRKFCKICKPALVGGISITKNAKTRKLSKKSSSWRKIASFVNFGKPAFAGGFLKFVVAFNPGHKCSLRWFETVSSTFQDLEFDGSL